MALRLVPADVFRVFFFFFDDDDDDDDPRAPTTAAAEKSRRGAEPGGLRRKAAAGRGRGVRGQVQLAPREALELHALRRPARQLGGLRAPRRLHPRGRRLLRGVLATGRRGRQEADLGADARRRQRANKEECRHDDAPAVVAALDVGHLRRPDGAPQVLDPHGPGLRAGGRAPQGHPLARRPHFVAPAPRLPLCGALRRHAPAQAATPAAKGRVLVLPERPRGDDDVGFFVHVVVGGTTEERRLVGVVGGEGRHWGGDDADGCGGEQRRSQSVAAVSLLRREEEQREEAARDATHGGQRGHDHSEHALYCGGEPAGRALPAHARPRLRQSRLLLALVLPPPHRRRALPAALRRRGRPPGRPQWQCQEARRRRHQKAPGFLWCGRRRQGSL
mmetsp:Transcript_8879/g.27322  ORF Transcript_8879/g.27322 Transcript_8879/m.27322 type:complete len:390 (+) Transcript_8879:930-2099(+)